MNGTAAEQRGNTLKRFNYLFLEAKASIWPAKAIIWPWLSYVCFIRLTEVNLFKVSDPEPPPPSPLPAPPWFPMDDSQMSTEVSKSRTKLRISYNLGCMRFEVFRPNSQRVLQARAVPFRVLVRTSSAPSLSTFHQTCGARHVYRLTTRNLGSEACGIAYGRP